jgi:hypothetical protein
MAAGMPDADIRHVSRQMPSIPAGNSQKDLERVEARLGNQNAIAYGVDREIGKMWVVRGLVARGRSDFGSRTQAKPPAPPPRLNSLRLWWGRHSACQDFCHGLLGALMGVCLVLSIVEKPRLRH